AGDQRAFGRPYDHSRRRQRHRRRSTAFGGSLRVRGNASFDSSYELPRTGWRLIGRPGQNKGYEFHSTAGPITRLVVRAGGRLTLKGSGALAQTLDVDPVPVDVVLQTGARRYCMTFGGVASFLPNKRLRAVDAPPPASCPALADWPMYG